MRIWRAASAAFIPYSLAVMCPICQVPSISLPRHQYFTPCGFSMPWARRSSLQRVPFSTLQYSTRAADISAPAVPKLVASRGSDPTARHQATNSLVPNWFVSSGVPGPLSTRGRALFGPTPSRQS